MSSDCQNVFHNFILFHIIIDLLNTERHGREIQLQEIKRFILYSHPSFFFSLSYLYFSPRRNNFATGNKFHCLPLKPLNI